MAWSFQIGKWKVNPEVREVTDGSNTRRLSPRAMAVLKILVEARGDVVGRETLLDIVWPNVEVGEESVTTAISELRRAFGERRGSAEVIETVQKSGYRLVASVSFVQEQPKMSSSPLNQSTRGFDLDSFLLCQEIRRLRQSVGPLGYAQALTMCENVLALTPDCAITRAEHATTSAFLALYCAAPKSMLQDALKMAESSVSLRPDLADGHMAMGVILGALKERFDARYSYQTALALAPNDGESFFQCARTLFSFGDLQNAARAAERASALLTDDYRPLYVAAAAYQALGSGLRADTLLNAAEARIRARLETDPDEPRALNALAAIHGWRGQASASLEIIDRLQAGGKEILYYKISALASIGETRIALQGIEQLVDDGYREAGWLRHDPGFRKLNKEPGYQRLMDQLEAA